MGKLGKKALLFIGAGLLIGYMAALAILWLAYDAKDHSLRTETIARMNSALSAVTEVYAKTTELAFDQTIRNPEFLELYRISLYSSKPQEKPFWRGLISDRLRQRYEKLAYYHIRTLNLIEPDGTVFLRMRHPQLYGDNVLEFSTLQQAALRERKPVHGFQLGRTDNLYRYSFPLFFGNAFLGSAEFGLSPVAITEQLRKEVPGNYTIILRKEKVDPILLPAARNRYPLSKFSDLFLEDRIVHDEPLPLSEPGPEEQEEILEQVRRTCREHVAGGESFLLSGKAGSLPYAAVFLQVKAPGGPPLGYIVASMKDSRFEELRSLFFLFAALVTGLFVLAGSLVLQWLKYQERLVDEALYDGLTGGLKQGRFDDIASRECSLARRHSLPLSLVLFDLDHFKAVNDRFGHLKGDAVLAETGNSVRRILRKSDYFFRWGGDEFLLVLPGTNLSGAICAAEKIRFLVGNMTLEEVAGLSISAGAAEMGESDMDLRAVLKRADEALYRAKENGRNTVRT